MPSTTVGTPSSFGLLLLLAAWYNNELAIVGTVINSGRSSSNQLSLKSAPPSNQPPQDQLLTVETKPNVHLPTKIVKAPLDLQTALCGYAYYTSVRSLCRGMTYCSRRFWDVTPLSYWAPKYLAASRTAQIVCDRELQVLKKRRNWWSS